MIFAILTLISALALAAVAGWFSIVGFMTIYAGAPMYALIMGVVTECTKLVTTSWLYRNWEHADWKLKVPLLYFTLALMTATSIGVFGFLSKAHIEQGSSTVDNSAKIESLNYQINREKSIISDNEKVILQLDETVNSFLGKDKADRALSVRKSQMPQRKQLQEDSAAAQKRIDELSKEKFILESEVRKLQLEVGPIRYIAELIYGAEDNGNKNIEAAVRIFTLLIVSTLDPLAVILLIAANHTLIRLKREEENKISKKVEEHTEVNDGSLLPEKNFQDLPEDDKEILETIQNADSGGISEVSEEVSSEASEIIPKTILDEIKEATLAKMQSTKGTTPISFVRSPNVTSIKRLEENEKKTVFSKDLSKKTDTVIQELLSFPHFTPTKLNEENESQRLDQLSQKGTKTTFISSPEKIKEISPEAQDEIKEIDEIKKNTKIDISTDNSAQKDKYPKALSWVNVFKGN